MRISHLLAMFLALLTIVPLLVVLSAFGQPQGDVWQHLAQFVLPGVLLNTAWLLAGTLAGVLSIGVSLAWLTAMYRFPGQRFFSWALLLPLAMPAYVMAFSQIGLFDFTGPIQSYLREIWPSFPGLPPIRSRGGVMLVMVFALYPYVYLLARTAFLSQGRRALEAAQSLGLSRLAGFWRVALPMARPWIAGGAMLALMECLADFGTVSIFNYDTFTTAIYKSWFSLFNLPAAMQLAALLVLVVLLLAWLELRERGRRQYAGRLGAPFPPVSASRFAGWLMLGYCSLILLLAFGLPLGQLLWWAWLHVQEEFDSRYLAYVVRSVSIAGFSASLVALGALVLAWVSARHSGRWMMWINRMATLGYAVPGTVLAVGIFVPVAWLDNVLIEWLSPWGWSGGAILKGTLLVMLLAYMARFLAVGYQSVEAGFARITPAQADAARSLGCSERALLWRVYLPQLRGGMWAALLLVFVDVMKEMPISLMTRPFGWDTLAIRIFELTSEGEWERAALPALAIVGAGLLPVWFLSRNSEQQPC